MSLMRRITNRLAARSAATHAPSARSAARAMAASCEGIRLAARAFIRRLTARRSVGAGLARCSALDRPVEEQRERIVDRDDEHGDPDQCLPSLPLHTEMNELPCFLWAGW